MGDYPNMVSFFATLTVVLLSGDGWTSPTAKQSFENAIYLIYILRTSDGETCNLIFINYICICKAALCHFLYRTLMIDSMMDTTIQRHG